MNEMLRNNLYEFTESIAQSSHSAHRTKIQIVIQQSIFFSLAKRIRIVLIHFSINHRRPGAGIKNSAL